MGQDVALTNSSRSMSMNKIDKPPLENSPVYGKLRACMNNRLGAVYSALYSFWSARQAAVGRQYDANTIILHAENTKILCENDSRRSPNELLDLLLPNRPIGGNSFDRALKAADSVISKWWDDPRPPVIIFLSDGIASVSDSTVRKLFQKAARKGCVIVFNRNASLKLYVTYRKGLSLHAILFGPKKTSLRMRQMVDVALKAQSETPALKSPPSSFHEALDSVCRFSLSATYIHLTFYRSNCRKLSLASRSH